MKTSYVAAIVVGGALVLGAGGASALDLASHHSAPVAAAVQSPAAQTAPASTPSASKAPVKPAVKKPRPAASATGNTHNGPTYNAPVTIINEAPQPGSTVYVPVEASAPYYVTTNQGVVQQYYDYLNAKDFSSAWAMGGQYIGGSDYNSWAAGYAGTSYIALSTWDYYPGYNAVGVTITATQTDGSVKTYSGSYTVNGGDITSASIVQDGGSSASSNSGSAASSGLRYVGSGVYAGPNTSDSFALSVYQAYAAGNYWNQSGTSQFDVYSSVTGQTYLMTSSSVGNPVIVTGGNGALVEFDYSG